MYAISLHIYIYMYADINCYPGINQYVGTNHHPVDEFLQRIKMNTLRIICKSCVILQTIFSRRYPKLSPQDIEQAEDYLETAFSDNVSVTIFLPMIKAEDINPTFEYPQNWKKLSNQEKADLIVINNMIKLICVADFSSHYFKEVFLISTSIEQILNKDSRLDINALKKKQPDIDNVLQEIKKTRRG